MKTTQNTIRLSVVLLFFLSVLCGFSVLAEGSSPVDVHGALHVSGAQLMDEKGDPVQLRGISSHGLSWFPEYVNYDMMRQMKEEWNVSLFRLAMYTQEYNDYLAGDKANREALKALIDTAVQDAEKLGLYLIIDWHTLSDNNPIENVDEAIEFWDEMAEKYATKKHVIFEICNEPNGSTTWQEVKAYALEVLPVIRAHTDAVVLIGTPTWSQDIHKAAEDPIEGYDNILYTLHFYAATHKDELRSRLTDAVENGLPVFVSEFGICDASGNGAIDEYEADQWLTAMDETGVSYAMWNLSNKDESSAMILSSCAKTSNLTIDDLSQSGRWFVSRVGGLSFPSVLTSEDAPVGEISLSIDLSGTWESDGDNYYHYNLTIHNPSSSPLSPWSAQLLFSSEITVQDAWNGNYAAEGHALTITPLSYNNRIESGTSLSDIGFIIKGETGLEIQSLSIGGESAGK